MTANETGVRRVAVLPAHEVRRLGDYGRPSFLSEQELLAGHGIRLEMLRDLDDAPACPVKHGRGPCPCGGHRA